MENFKKPPSNFSSYVVVIFLFNILIFFAEDRALYEDYCQMNAEKAAVNSHRKIAQYEEWPEPWT